MKICKKHGVTDGYLTKDGYLRCRKCRTEAVTNRRKRVKVDLVKEHGGKCCICGYDRCTQALQFHHVDPKTKKFSLAERGHCRSWEQLLQESKKCVLLCANCHAEVENGITELAQ